MAESYSQMLGYLGAVHTASEDDRQISMISGGYVIVSDEQTTIIKSEDNPQGITFPREALPLVVQILSSHIPSDEGDGDDDEDGEGE